MYNTLTSPSVIKTSHQIKSDFLKRIVDVEIFSPDNLLGNESINLLLLNDGQDLEQMNMENALSYLYEKWKIGPTVVVGIKASADRLMEYGIANRLDFKKRGAKAGLYTDFIIKELIPYVQSEVDLSING
ncbi:MAG: esterase family protein, partial [Pedobacter sp.]|nr:esterase family protein [Pedobacter sp.]